MPDVLLSNGKRFSAPSDVSILDAARQVGLTLDHSCATGRCGVCKAHVVSGETRVLGREEALTDSDLVSSNILTCRRAALTDVMLDVEDLGLPDNIVRKILPCRIDGMSALASDVMRIMLRLPPTSTFAYLPGQYVNVIGPNGIRRSYSIANANSGDKRIELHIRHVPGGSMSQYWFEKARLNDLLRIDGPIGTFFHRGDEKDTILLVTGTGYAPAKAILENLAANGWKRHISLFWGGRHRQDLYLAPEQDGLDLDFHPVLSREKAPHAEAGHVQDVLLAHRRDFRDAVVYACGSELMIASARSALESAGLSPKSFHSDAFVHSSPESGDT